MSHQSKDIQKAERLREALRENLRRRKLAVKSVKEEKADPVREQP